MVDCEGRGRCYGWNKTEKENNFKVSREVFNKLVPEVVLETISYSVSNVIRRNSVTRKITYYHIHKEEKRDWLTSERESLD